SRHRLQRDGHTELPLRALTASSRRCTGVVRRMVGNVCGAVGGRSSTCSSRATSRASSPAIAADARGGRARQDPPAGLRTYLYRGNLRGMVREGKMETQFLRRGLGNAATVVAVTLLIVGGLVAPASAAENSYTV